MPRSHESFGSVQPLKPSEILPAKLELMPDEVMQVFNDLIAVNFTRGKARVLQKDVVNRLVALGHSANDIYKNHWLDVEGIYKTAGWKVIYDKPAYNETYDAYFEFSDTEQ